MIKKKRNILVFDNNHDILKDIAQNVIIIGANPIMCDSIYVANDMWIEHYNNLSGLIIDLMMPVDGFSSSQISRSNDGHATGWVWFIDNVINGENGRPSLVKNTIFFSGYLTDLEQSVSHDERMLLANVKKIDKAERKRWIMLQKYVKQLL